MTAADAKEHDVGVVAQTLGSGENSVKLVGAAQVSGITDNELILEPPLSAQRVFTGGDWNDVVVLGPVGNDVDAILRDTARGDFFCYVVAEDDIGRCGFEAAVAQNGDEFCDRTLEEGHTELDSDFGIDVL